MKPFCADFFKKPHRTLSKLSLSLLFLLFSVIVLSGCGTNEPTATPLTDINVTLRAEPDPPAVGESTLVIVVKDTSGQPITDASLSVRGDMEHAGMDAFEGTSDTSQNGEYRIPFQWEMGGNWSVTVTATLPDGKGVFTKSFNLFVEAVSKDSIVNQGMAGMETPTPTSGQ